MTENIQSKAAITEEVKMAKTLHERWETQKIGTTSEEKSKEMKAEKNERMVRRAR